MNNRALDKTEQDDLIEISGLAKVLLFLLLLSFSEKFIIQKFDKYFVDLVIGSIYKSQLNTIETLLTLSIFFYCIYLISERIAKVRYKVRWYSILLMIVPLALYVNERLFGDRYTFTTIMEDADSHLLKFLDFPFALAAVLIGVCVVNRLCEPTIKRSEDLVIDVPLTLTHQDNFERKQVYESLIKQIADINYNQKRSFNIGIVNKWAEGKTSFLNFIEDELKEDSQNTLVIKFNAWFTSQSDNLTNDFFKTLDDELSNHIYTGSLIRRYANNLTQLNSVFNPAKYLPQNWINDTSNQQYFEKIELLLRRLNKRIFIIVDDIDRLDNKEVFNVFRMIRNSANFPYVIFLVPFDKEYVVHALEENKIFSPNEYIKKIFDVEISLTPIFKGYLQPIIHDLLSGFIEKSLVGSTEKDRERLTYQMASIFAEVGFTYSKTTKYSSINSALFRLLKNKRDIIRFTNSVKLSVKYNFNKLYLPDLLILELIKYQDICVYRKLFENKDYLKIADEEGRKVLRPIEDGHEKDVESDVFDFLNTDGESYSLFRSKKLKEDDSTCNKECKKDSADKEDRADDDLEQLIKALYSKPEVDDYKSELSIYFNVNYLNYIQHNIVGLKYEDLNELIDGKKED